MGVFEIPLPVRAEIRGSVPNEALDLAVQRIRAVSRYAGGRVQFAEVKITAGKRRGADCPTLAQAKLRARGRIVRAHAAGATPAEAIQRLGDRLRAQLERVTAPWPHQRIHSAAWTGPAHPRRPA